jgi:hypothetical protein
MGIHRGPAKGFSMSGLATLNATFLASNSTGADNVFAFQFTPALISQATWLFYGFGTSIAGAPTTAAPLLIPSSVAEAYRVVSAQFTLTPSGALLNQAGSGLIGYIPDNSAFTSSATNLANLAIHRPFKANDTVILHWLPTENSSQDETEFQAIGATPTYGSTFYGYFNIPTASDQLTLWQIDVQIGVEYIPTPAYRPYVDKKSPIQDERAQNYVNMFAEKYWLPLMIGTWDEYSDILRKQMAMSGKRAVPSDYRGKVGTGNPVGPNKTSFARSLMLC